MDRSSTEHAKFRALFNLSQEGILLANDEGRYVDANPAACGLFGMKRERILGRSVEDFADPRRREEVRSNWRRFLRQGSQQGLFRIFRPDGTTRHVDYRATARIFPGRHLSVLRDITERNQAERALRERENRLRTEIMVRKKVERALRSAKTNAEAAARAKSEFLANISHEIRTPINGLLGTLELLRATPLSQEQLEYADIMDESGKTLMALVNELLDFSRIEAGKIKIDVKNFDLEQTLDSALAMFAHRIQFKKLELVSKISKGLPTRLRGDPIRLRQLLMNLIGNAIKFTERGKIVLTIAKERESRSEIVLKFSIQDTGPGIPKGQQRLLFQPFSQLGRSSRRLQSGTGLGLAISKQLVDYMGGSIGMFSKAGRGSTFWFSLPYKFYSDSPRTSATQTTQSPWSSPRPVRFPIQGSAHPSAHPTYSPKILVAEDNRINRVVVVRQLQKLGHAADTVANGAEAVEAAKTGSYDLILMDCQMPVMDGIEATLAIRRSEKKRRTPIVAMTAYAMEEDRRRCLAVGMDDHITKPLAIERLRTLLEQYSKLKAPVDLERLKQISSPQDKDLSELTDLYTKDVTSTVRAIAQAIRHRTPEKVKTLAHSALGASQMLGMTAITRPLRRLEDMGERGDLAGAPAVLRETKNELARIQAYLRHSRKEALC